MAEQLISCGTQAWPDQRSAAVSDEDRHAANRFSGAARGRTRTSYYRRTFQLSFLAFISLAFAGGASHSQAGDHVRFLINYGGDLGDRTAAYDVVVLDPDTTALASARRRPSTILLGYLSLGEVHSGRDYFPQVQAEGFVLRPNPSWPDARFIDLRDRRWHKRVIESLVPKILAKGFNGIFFDTLDDAEFLEKQDPVRFAGMVDAAAELLREVRRRFPGIHLMVNRGYAVLPHAPGSFDMLLGESVFTTFDAASGTYRFLSDGDYHWQVERMRDARKRDPKLRLFSLDYWNADDAPGIARIYTRERANGFIPYVGTPDLTRIVPEP